MRIAVISNGGVNGLVAAQVLAKNGAQVVLYDHDQNKSCFGHEMFVNIDGVDIDLSGFTSFHQGLSTDMIELLDYNLQGVDIEKFDMSFSVSLGNVYEWGTRNGISSLFAQKKNCFNPYFWQMLRDVFKFKLDAFSYLEELEKNPKIYQNQTLEEFIKSKNYSELFSKAYLIPLCQSLWPCSIGTLSAFSVLSHLWNHNLIQILGRSQWITIKQGLGYFVNKVKEELESLSCRIRTGCEVDSISTNNENGGCSVICGDGCEEKFDGCILDVDAPEALRILGKQTTFDEIRILGAFPYVQSDIFLHRDQIFMPQNSASWSACNFVGTTDGKVCLTYWLNVIQNIGETKLPFLVTRDPDHTPERTLLKWTTNIPVPSVASAKAAMELHLIQGKRGIWFCGAYQDNGICELGPKSGKVAALEILGKGRVVTSRPKRMSSSLTETGARFFVIQFLENYISTGSLVLLEEGGELFRFEGTEKGCSLKSVLRIHSPQFYWKVMTRSDLGVADAYINGDFSFVDEDEGLLNFLLILIYNRDSYSSASNLKKERGWWTPLLFMNGIASAAKYFFNHISNKNSLTQARRNISRHYDLNNELFATFLGETMSYSSGIFKMEVEDLKAAQMRKFSSLIEKARIEEKHEVLDIGCGWGTFAIEVVKRTGCKYTGITLSEEQLKFAQTKVMEAGLQDRIKFHLWDYRQVPKFHKYDRIISCEMIEHVGHEYMDEFFSCCESLLAGNGLFVLQFISMPEEYYDDYRRSSGFIKEYIFPGGSLPSLSTVITAMAAKSRFSVESLENIGIHYHPTLRWWRKNFLEDRSKIEALGFDEKFIRTWEYYFDYCAAGFKSRTLGDYQVVFSRPRNTATLSILY